MIEVLMLCFVLALATSTISVTVAEADIFKPFRKWLLKQNKWLGELFSCFYCFSHYVALGFVFVYQPRILSNIFIIDMIVSWFVIIAISTLVVRLSWWNRTGISSMDQETEKPKKSKWLRFTNF